MLKILIPVDGSQSVNHAIEAVAAMCGTGGTGVEVTLVNIRDLPIMAGSLPVFDADELDRFLKRQQDEILTRAAADSQKLGLNVVARHGAAGAPGPKIVAIAEQYGVDQIAMGNRGPGALDHLCIGSVALRVLQLAKVPVLIVK